LAGHTPAVADEARWQELLAALAAYLASGQDWPRHKATVIGQEHELGVWLHSQRFRQRRGELDPAKADALRSPRAVFMVVRSFFLRGQIIELPMVYGGFR